ncbi:uncharacterized protein LOC128235924 isoform X3 [Mya arenaria]|uniref:uncharacterized protein LOC128235924 isoform X3 n=1 Tax=Mya arenaria TaxID=6604 RepID=UPI0022E43D5D|nr:uncharacterized protein LOC128235924 isoform X3 [Mya arenaria]
MEFEDADCILKTTLVTVKDYIKVSELIHYIKFTEQTAQEIKAKITNNGEAYSASYFFDAVKKNPSTFFPALVAATKKCQPDVFNILDEEVRNHLRNRQTELKKVLNAIAEKYEEFVRRPRSGCGGGDVLNLEDLAQSINERSGSNIAQPQSLQRESSRLSSASSCSDNKESLGSMVSSSSDNRLSFDNREKEEGILYTGKSKSCDWPSFVHHCTQAREIWIQYHRVLPKFGLRINKDILESEKLFLYDLTNVPVYFAFVGPLTVNIDTKLATILKDAKKGYEAFENMCLQNQIAPLVIISHVDSETQAFHHANTYKKAVSSKRECVVVMVFENKPGKHSDSLEQLITYISEGNAMAIHRDVLLLLKRWTYKMLAEKLNVMKMLHDFTKDGQLPSLECVQRLSCHGIEKDEAALTSTRNERLVSVRKLKEILEESNSLYSRNHLPAEDIPDCFSISTQRPDKGVLDQITNMDGIIGCGDRFGTLLILIKEEVENRAIIEEELTSKLNDFKPDITNFEFKYVSQHRYFMKSGDNIYGSNKSKSGTLADFNNNINDK